VRDILQLENEVAQTIAAQVGANLTRPEPARAARHRPIDPQAYEEYLQADHYWKERTAEAIAKAIEHFNRAIERDPNYAEAWKRVNFRSLVSRMTPSMIPCAPTRDFRRLSRRLASNSRDRARANPQLPHVVDLLSSNRFVRRKLPAKLEQLIC